MKKVERKTIAFAGNHRDELLDELVERAKPYVRESLARWLDQILERTISRVSSEHPFRLTFKEFAKLSEDEQIAWGDRVLALEKIWLDERLAKRKAEWILVVGGKIVKSSAHFEKLPSKKEVYRIAKSLGFAPFLYSKEILIEESGNAWGSSSWSRISLSDFYPTITFHIGRANWSEAQIISHGKPIVADFDTGCSTIIVDETEIDESILSGIEIRFFSTHLNRPYNYRACKVKVAVLTKEEKIKATPFLARLVRNWKKKPLLCNKSR